MNGKLIGEGGSSKVYRIWSKEKNDFVVEKRSRYPLVWESVWLRKLQGFSVPKFYGIRKEKGCWILMMEYVYGKTLEELIAEQSAKNRGLFEIVENVIIELIRIRRIYPDLVFCDLKPSNIIVNRDCQITFIDFDSVSRAGVKKICKGTRPYAAPEIFQGIPDRKSDIYSIAQIVWQINDWKLDGLFFGVIAPCIRKEVPKRQGNPEWLLKKIKIHRIKLQILHILEVIGEKIRFLLLVFAVLFIVIWLLEKNHDIIKFTRAVRDCIIVV